MTGWRRSTLVSLTILVLFLVSATTTAVSAMKAVMIPNTGGLNDYVSANNSFAHGDTLKVYTELRDVNYGGYVAVDFFFVIKEHQGHVVSMDHLEVNRRTYESDVYVVYTKTIPSWWLYGKYNLDVYAYNRLNKAKINEINQILEVTSSLKRIFSFSTGDDDYFDDVRDLVESACSGNRDDLEDLGIIRPITNSLEELTTLQFFVRRPEELKKAEVSPHPQPLKETVIEGSKVIVTDVQTDKFEVKSSAPVTISVAVKNEGQRGTNTIALFINDEKEAETAVTLDSGASETLHFMVAKKQPGTYKVTIPGTNIVKVFFVKEGEGKGIQEPSPSPVTTTVGITQNLSESTQGSHPLMEGLFAGSVKKSTQSVLLTSVFDLICQQISLTKVVSFFVF